MAAGNVIVYDKFKQYIFDGTLDLDSNTINVALTTNSYSPAITTDALFSDVTNELTTLHGYTAGGAALANKTVNFDASANTTSWDADDRGWTASGGSIGPFRKAVIYAVGTLNGHINPLIGYCVLDSVDITISDGNTFIIQWNASGLLTITGASS